MNKCKNNALSELSTLLTNKGGHGERSQNQQLNQ